MPRPSHKIQVHTATKIFHLITVYNKVKRGTVFRYVVSIRMRSSSIKNHNETAGLHHFDTLKFSTN
jgi:hypothetical protein